MLVNSIDDKGLHLETLILVIYVVFLANLTSEILSDLLFGRRDSHFGVHAGRLVMAMWKLTPTRDGISFLSPVSQAEYISSGLTAQRRRRNFREETLGHLAHQSMAG